MLIKRRSLFPDRFFDDDFFNDFFNRPIRRRGRGMETIREEDGKYLVDINLPGFNKEMSQ